LERRKTDPVPKSNDDDEDDDDDRNAMKIVAVKANKSLGHPQYL
jgi:hypothetical protein